MGEEEIKAKTDLLARGKGGGASTGPQCGL